MRQHVGFVIGFCVQRLLAKERCSLLQTHAAVLQAVHASHVSFQAGLVRKSCFANWTTQGDEIVDQISSFRRIKNGSPFLVALAAQRQKFLVALLPTNISVYHSLSSVLAKAAALVFDNRAHFQVTLRANISVLARMHGSN